MGFNLKTLFNTAADLLPGGTLVKSIVQGAGSLLLKKAGKKVGVKEEQIDSILRQAQKLADEDEEIKKAIREEEESRRQFELAFYGRAADLSPRAQLWRAITRPLISFGLVGLFVIGILIHYGQQLCGLPSNELLKIPGEVLQLTKWVIAFWFSSRGLEKILGAVNKR